MEDLLRPLTAADYHFLVGLIQSNANFTNDFALKLRLLDWEELQTDQARDALHQQLEHEIRYLGSADLAYFTRYLVGEEPGVPFREVVLDVARALKLHIPSLGTDRELVESLVEAYVSAQFAQLSRSEQQRTLENLGVEKEAAAAFVKKTAGVFVLPVMIEAFGALVVDGLIRNVVFGTIARLIGQRMAEQLLRIVAARFPWWLRWVGPVVWTISISWTLIDLQGPATRKTIPIILYLGLCSRRERLESVVPSE
jgi:uncharacterized protein YaaW (UPF0174 family)